MDDEGAELPTRPAHTQRHRPKWLLPSLLAPIIALVLMNYAASILQATLVKRHPAILITLSSQNRWLILASEKLDPLTFYGIGFLRLVVADPLFYFLGLYYGDAALRWIERKMAEGAAVFLWMEKAFEKARYPMVLIAPNNVICLLAGATQMAPAVFIPLNAAGTVGRLYLIRLLGEAFNSPISSVTNFLDRWRWPLLAISVVSFAILVKQGKAAELRDIGELKRDIEQEEREP
jgi:membrane protein DedA with SNARE-associated domain